MPQLDLLGVDAVAAPVGRARDGEGGRGGARLGALRDAELRSSPRVRGFELLARRDRLALGAGPRADARVEWARREVVIGFGVAGVADGAADPHLPLLRPEQEGGGGVRVRAQRAALGAALVGVEDQRAALRLERLAQHEAHFGAPGLVDRGERDRVGIDLLLRGKGFGEPRRRDRERVGGQGLRGEPGVGPVAHAGNVSRAGEPSRARCGFIAGSRTPGATWTS